MFYIKLLNKNGKSFTKKYNSYYLYTKALIKYKYSKQLKILSYGGF